MADKPSQKDALQKALADSLLAKPSGIMTLKPNTMTNSGAYSKSYERTGSPSGGTTYINKVDARNYSKKVKPQSPRGQARKEL